MPQSKKSTTAQSPFPFMDADITQMMAEMRMPGFDMQSMMDLQRKNIKAVNQANQTAIDCMQAVSRRQVDIMRETMTELSTAMQQMMAEGGPEDKLAKQTELTKDAFEKALAHMRELSDMVTKANHEAMEIMSERVTQSLEELKTQVEEAKK